MSEERYFIGPGLRDKLRETITRVDGMSPPQAASAGGMHQSLVRDMSVFHIGTASGAWSKNGSKTVTWKYISATPNTVTAVNLFANLTTTATYNVAVVREGTAWYLISAEC